MAPARGCWTALAPPGFLGGRNDSERRERLFAKVDELLDVLHMPRSLREAGVNEETYLQARADLARAAFTDASIRTNPRMPLIREILDLLDAGYYGRPDAAAPAS